MTKKNLLGGINFISHNSYMGLTLDIDIICVHCVPNERERVRKLYFFLVKNEN